MVGAQADLAQWIGIGVNLSSAMSLILHGTPVWSLEDSNRQWVPRRHARYYTLRLLRNSPFGIDPRQNRVEVVADLMDVDPAWDDVGPVRQPEDREAPVDGP